MARDFSTISPSARSLLMVKAHTSLPYARHAAELVFGADAVAAAADAPDAARRRAHFEQRARSLDEALDALGMRRILELASGLSFRGLVRAAARSVHYVDTDLPEMAALKTELIAQLAPPPLAGTLRIEPLNALDDAALPALLETIPPGPIAIIHEGLLMYLDDAEKAQLAANIRAALRRRVGFWITADIYIRSATHLHRDAATQRFLDEHRVEERKFADWAAADGFFAEHGFRVEAKLAPSEDPWRVRETWTMKLR